MTQVASGLKVCLHGWSPRDIVYTSKDWDVGIGGDLGVRHGNDIWRCNSVSVQYPSIGSVPSVAVLSTPAACYSTGGSSNRFAHKVEHGVHSTNECASTAMCQAASGFTPREMLDHCALSRAHNLLNSVPSNVLGRE